MSKHVISIGFDIPGSSATSEGFRSSDSLLDADVIVFSPSLSEYSRIDDYKGKARLDDNDSARVRSDAAHWQRELRIALEAGKTVFVMLIGVEDVFVHTGEKRYEGTGRNARVSSIVTTFDPYSSIPVPGLGQAIQRKTGERIKTTQNLGPLAAYWREFGNATYFQVYLDPDIGTPSLVTQTGDKMVGGIVRLNDLKGTIVLLPPPNLSYMVEERAEQQKGKKKRRAQSNIDNDPHAPNEAEISVGNQFLSALIEIDKVLRARSERSAAPSWTNGEEYALKEEMELRARVGELWEKITELQQQRGDAESDLDSAGNLRGLVFETGKRLESAILEALRVLGFKAEGYSDGESEFDAVFIDPSGGRLIGEAEGKNDKAINIDKLDQLERNIQEDFKKTAPYTRRLCSSAMPFGSCRLPSEATTSLRNVVPRPRGPASRWSGHQIFFSLRSF